MVLSPFNKSVTKNEYKKCAVPSCYNHRRKVSKWCKQHGKAQSVYGSPEGHSINKREYRREVQEITVFLSKHSEHKGIQAAIKYFESWLARAATGEKVHGREVFQWLSINAVTGRECLHIVLTLWLYSYRNGNKLPDDDRLTFMFSHGLLSLCKKPSRVSSHGRSEFRTWIRTSSRRAIGREIREMLGVLCMNVFKAIYRELEEEDRLRAELSERF